MCRPVQIHQRLLLRDSGRDSLLSLQEAKGGDQYLERFFEASDAFLSPSGTWIPPCRQTGRESH